MLMLGHSAERLLVWVRKKFFEAGLSLFCLCFGFFLFLIVVFGCVGGWFGALSMLFGVKLQHG